LAALRLKGERNYVDINLTKADKKGKRFADITLTLKSVDIKKHTYTVDVMADDTLIAKKDKSLNEPVQFLTAKGGHTPYEIVINKVAKDQIVGYLSTPKDASSR
jgi:predicted MarR family transcription regulator